MVRHTFHDPRASLRASFRKIDALPLDGQHVPVILLETRPRDLVLPWEYYPAYLRAGGERKPLDYLYAVASLLSGNEADGQQLVARFRGQQGHAKLGIEIAHYEAMWRRLVQGETQRGL